MYSDQDPLLVALPWWFPQPSVQILYQFRTTCSSGSSHDVSNVSFWFCFELVYFLSMIYTDDIFMGIGSSCVRFEEVVLHTVVSSKWLPLLTHLCVTSEPHVIYFNFS